MCVVGLGRAEHVYMWMEWCGEQRRTTSETMPVDLGMCPPIGSKHSSGPGEITIDEFSGKGLLREALLDSGCPLKFLEAIREEARIPSETKREACSRRTQLP